MTTRSLLALALLSSVAACKLGGGETTTGASAACVAAGAACASDADCCSYGCLSGICVANPVEGGACRTSDDCALGRLCKSGACRTPTAATCRDTGDVCTAGWPSAWGGCCSGNCEGGACTVNRPPVASAGPDVPDAPYTRAFTLANGSSDPDGDPLTYGWTLLSAPAGSAATLSSQTAASPSFTPDRMGPYVLRLVVTEGPVGAPDRYTLEDQVTVVAVNRAPVATATAPAAQWSRNVPVAISGAASDPDGDALECAWRVTAPGETAPTEVVPFAACGNPSSPSFTYTPAGEGTYAVDLVVRDHDRTTSAVVNTTVATATFTSRNDPPVPATTRAPYYANMGATPGVTPAVTLDAAPSTDPNGDHLETPGLTFFWEAVSVSDGGALPALSGWDTATPSFVPDRVADYVLQVTVADQARFGRPSATATLQVTVSVGRYVQQLGHGVVDSARAAAAGKIVLAGQDPADATKGMLWVYDTASGSEGAGIRLVDPLDATVSGIPRLLDVTPDGTRAVVVDEGVSIWIVTLGPTPSMTRVTRPYAIAHVVVAGGRYAYLFGSGTYDTVRQLDLNGGAITTPAGWPGYGKFGAAYHGATTAYLYRVDDVFHYWYQTSVNNSGASSSYTSAAAPTCGAGYPPAYASAVWATQNTIFANAYLVTSCGDVYRADTLASLGKSLGVLPSHVDSTAGGAVLAVTGSQLVLFDGALGPAGSDLLPRWAQDGYGRTAWATKAFFDAAGTKRLAVVRDTSTPARYGIVTFP